MQASVRRRSARRRRKCSLETATRQSRCGPQRCVVIFVSSLVCESQFLPASSFCRAHQRAYAADPPAAVASAAWKRRRDRADAVVFGELSRCCSAHTHVRMLATTRMHPPLTAQASAFQPYAGERAQPFKPPPSQVSFGSDTYASTMQSSSVRVSCMGDFCHAAHYPRQQAAFGAPVSERAQPIRPPPSQVLLGSDPSAPMQSSAVGNRVSVAALKCIQLFASLSSSPCSKLHTVVR
jgi:hypothetical protein